MSLKMIQQIKKNRTGTRTAIMTKRNKQRNKNKESPTTRKPVRYEGTEFILKLSSVVSLSICKMCVCTLHIVMGFCDITLNVSLKHFSILAGSGIELS